MSNRIGWLTLGLVLGSACAGCAAEQEIATPSAPEDWGPLAVWDDPGTGDTDLAAVSGVVSIDEECVTLGETVELVWPGTFTRWVPDEGSIQFLNPDTSVVIRIEGGDLVELGGGEVVADLPWIVPPDSGCAAALFGAGSVGSVNGIAP